MDLAKYGDPAPELPGAEVDGGVCSKVPWGLSSVISSGAGAAPAPAPAPAPAASHLSPESQTSSDEGDCESGDACEEETWVDGEAIWSRCAP